MSISRIKQIKRILKEHDVRDPRGALNAIEQVVKQPKSIPLTEAAQKCSRIRQLSVAELLAETIRRISKEDSVSSLFID